MTRKQREQRVRDLAAKHGWDEVELTHAIETAGDVDHGDESSVELANGRELRCPAFPKECDYVRVVQDGCELAYWDIDEWAESPAEVMGAIIGAMKGNA
jgi:hypothetical protein